MQGTGCLVTFQGYILCQGYLPGDLGAYLTEHSFRVFFLTCCHLLSLPLIMAGALVSCIPHHCLLCF